MTRYIEVDIIKNDLLKNISNKYNISLELLLKELDNINKVKTINSKYSCDHDFFSRDTEESFYWAGFIAADGCLYKKIKSKTLSIYLSENDYKHLEKFKENINFDGIISKSVTKHSLKNPKWKDSIKNGIQISSEKIFDDLSRFGICPNKSLIYEFPEWLHNHIFVRHFIRGYIDGDGSFFYDKNRNRICLELRGTYQCMVSIQSILNKQTDKVINNKVTTPDSTSKVKYYGKSYIKDIVNYLYDDANIFLDRKKEVAIKSFEL